MKVVPFQKLLSFTKSVLHQVGLDAFSQEAVATGLCETSLRGVDTHGIRLLPHYIKSAHTGRKNPRPNFKFIENFPIAFYNKHHHSKRDRIVNNYEDNQLKEYHICLFEIYHADDHVDDFIKLLNIGYDLTNKKAGGFTFVESLVVYHVDYQEEKVKDAVYKLIKTHLKKTDIERLANI